MSTLKKAIVSSLALLLSILAALPVPRADAAVVLRFDIYFDDYIIAGVPYVAHYSSDKASSTYQTAVYEYSTNNGLSWNALAVGEEWTTFSVPFDPSLTSATFRVGVHFYPLIGSNTYSEKTIGPVPILQPGDPSDFTAAPNDDGSVTLRWNDNTNMESYYRIVRSGPDGDKTFEVPNSSNATGARSYTDRQTNTARSTIYVYSLTPVVDQYELPENLQLGTVWATVKTKVPIRPLDALVDIDVPLIDPDALDPDDPVIVIDPGSAINRNIFDYLDNFNVNPEDVGKPAASGVTLDQSSVALLPGESQPLIATVTPADAANRSVVWSSDDSEIAEVDGAGKVTGKSPGITNITVTTAVGNFTDTAVVTVVESPMPDVPEPPVPPIGGFPDLAGHPAALEIEKAVTYGVVNGYEDGTFRPNGSVTRAEFASMLIRALQPEGEGASLAFKDAAEIGAWAVPAVRQAVEMGIINGYDDGTFRPNATITRAEMIAMVVRASGRPLGDSQSTGLSDDADIPEWAKPAVNTAMETGIIIVGGLPERAMFMPYEKSTRAEAASAIVRMLELPSSNQ